MSDWQQVGENLVRHKAGGIYLSAKVGGKKIRKSLGTTDLRIAKLKRDEALTSLRKAATAPAAGQFRTVGDAIDALSRKVLSQANLEEATVDYYRAIFKIMNDTLERDRAVRSLTKPEMMRWWRDIAKKYAPQRANNVLGMTKRLAKMLVESGTLLEDPTSDLKRKKIQETHLHSPSVETIEAIIADIRSQKKVWSDESADYVAFLAFTGCRLGQAQALTWCDIEEDWIVFRSGVTGTKGAATRRLPISGRLRGVIERMRTRRDGDASEKDAVFTISKPHQALNGACKRLGIPHLRLHDLRHFFATWAMESGINVRMVAGWLGHKDGGVLLLRRYAHMRDASSLEAAQKLQ